MRRCENSFQVPNTYNLCHCLYIKGNMGQSAFNIVMTPQANIFCYGIGTHFHSISLWRSVCVCVCLLVFFCCFSSSSNNLRFFFYLSHAYCYRVRTLVCSSVCPSALLLPVQYNIYCHSIEPMYYEGISILFSFVFHINQWCESSIYNQRNGRTVFGVEYKNTHTSTTNKLGIWLKNQDDKMIWKE